MLGWTRIRNLVIFKVHAAFNLLDSDRDGFVTRSDFKKKFHNLNSKQIDVVFQRFTMRTTLICNFRGVKYIFGEK